MFVVQLVRYFCNDHISIDSDGEDTAPDKLFVELAVRPYDQLTTYLIVPNIELPTTKYTTNLALS